jgi:hypothetical protein
VTVDYDHTVRFLFVIGQISAIGPDWMKGIEYVPGGYESKGDLVQTLDNARTLPTGVYLRKIEPDWFSQTEV